MHTHTHIYECTHTHTRTHTHTHTHIHVYVYSRIHVYMYTCIYIHKHRFNAVRVARDVMRRAPSSLRPPAASHTQALRSVGRRNHYFSSFVRNRTSERCDLKSDVFYHRSPILDWTSTFRHGSWRRHIRDRTSPNRRQEQVRIGRLLESLKSDFGGRRRPI